MTKLKPDSDPEPERATDQDLLQLIGAAADLVGLGEHFQRILPTDRLRAQRRHKRMEKLRAELRSHLNDARADLRIVTSVVATAVPGREPGEFAIAIPREELPVFRKGLDQLQVAIREMTRDTYELESVAATLPEEAQRYHRMSAGGQTVIHDIRAALDGSSDRTRELLTSVDRYLARCDQLLEEGDAWRSL